MARERQRTKRKERKTQSDPNEDQLAGITHIIGQPTHQQPEENSAYRSPQHHDDGRSANRCQRNPGYCPKARGRSQSEQVGVRQTIPESAL